MVTLDLDILVCREFSQMDAFSFVYYAMTHPSDNLRTTRFFNLCDDRYAERVIMNINHWGNYRYN